MFDRRVNRMRRFHNAVLVSLTAMFCLFSTAFAFAQTKLSVTSVSFGDGFWFGIK